MQTPQNFEKAKKRSYDTYLAAQAQYDAEQRPRRERRKKDSIVFAGTGLGFLAVGALLQFLNGYVVYRGAGFSPIEVMSVFMLVASSVLFLWAALKFVRS